MNQSFLNMLVFEFVCGGGWYRYPNFGSPIESSNESMLREGAAMLDAVVGKYLSDPEVHVTLTVPIDSLLLTAMVSRNFVVGAVQQTSLFQWIDDHRVQLLPVDSDTKLNDILDKDLKAFDAAIVIAPEIENALLAFTTQVESSGVKLLSPNREVVAIGSDKRLTCGHLNQYGIVTPECFSAIQTKNAELPEIIIVKPRFGAGSMNVKKIRSDKLDFKNVDSNYLIQEYVEGIPASIAIECDQESGRSSTFPLMRQIFAEDSFQYLSSERINNEGLQTRAEGLLKKVVESLPAFDGYLGIDIVLGASSEFDYVIEINPRYTSSFCFV